MFQKELKHFECIFKNITGKKCSCFPAEPPELGYTDKNANIYVAEKHSYYMGLSVAEQKMFRLGIFCHEMLHQIFSNFALLQKMKSKLSTKEYHVFLECNNLVEDAGIEYMSSLVLQGKLLKALRYMIQVIYEKTPFIETAQTPYQQFVLALIQFGDMGILKGQFTFPEAKECFTKAAPIFNRAVESKSSIVRKNSAMKIMELSKPLWKQEDFKDSSNSERSCRTLDEGTSCCDGKSIRVNETEEDKNNSAARNRKNYLQNPESNQGTQKFISISESDLAWVEASENMVGKRNFKDEEQKKEEKIDVSVKPTWPNASKILHLDVEPHSVEYYNQQMAVYRPMITTFTKKLQKIFQNDKSEVVKRKKGKLNIKRYYSPRKTARVFDRKTIPENIQDMAIVIAIDESGSMGIFQDNKKRTQIAKEIGACFAECFSSFQIPLYVFGYCDAVHNHYIKWRNTKKERTKLLTNKCSGGNYDGLSINWAVQLLRKRKEKHKLLIIITDGIPSIGNPEDVKEEVRKARNLGYAVLGVAIGEDAVNEIKFMYGKDFFHVESTKTAFQNVAKVISRMVQSWK